MDYLLRAQRAIAHCRSIAAFTEEPGVIVRTFLSEAARSCQRYLSDWMVAIGMCVELDGVGNLRGLYPGANPAAKRLIIGSHLDTVPDAGAFDGILGVVLAVTLLECLGGERLPFAVEVVGFSEEEGVRFGVPFIGSRALAGTLEESALAITDRAGVNIKQAICQFGLDPPRMREAALVSAAGAYLEFHIEQGPVLDNVQCPLGVVTAIVGQSRALATFQGKAGHAGTTPMLARYDALCAAAEWITSVETQGRATEGLAATVGRVETKPGVANVIPGEVNATLDVRHFSNEVRREATEKSLQLARDIARRRSIHFVCEIVVDQNTVAMNQLVTKMAELAIEKTGIKPRCMTSGAGHDAMILAPVLPSAMIFLRSPGGISHHPDETVQEEDVVAALRAGYQLLQDFRTCPLLI